MKKKNGISIAMFLALMFVFLNFISMPVWAGPGDVAIDATNFPAENFRNYVSAKFDTNNDGILSQDELDVVTEIKLYNVEINDLKGVEHFKKLERLECEFCSMTNLDVTKNVNLKELDCSSNKLNTLDVTKNVNLEKLSCYYNELNILDVTKNVNLKELNCSYNKLNTLDVTKNPKLKILYLSHIFQGNYYEVFNLDVSNCPELERLDCSSNQIAYLDLRHNPALKYFYCEDNKLTNIDLNPNYNFTECYISFWAYHFHVGNKTKTLDLSSLPGNFDPSKVSELTGGTISGNTLNVEVPNGSWVKFKYKVDDNITLNVKLRIYYKDEVAIKFDKNGGSGTMDDRIALKGLKYTLPDCTFTPPAGKEFKAWVIGTEEKNVGDSITVNEDLTVKAIWKEIPKHTITFDANTGTGTMAAVTKNEGDTYTLPDCTFTPPAGKEFKAWVIGTEEKNVGDSITVNADTTVKAIWKEKPVTPSANVTITFDKNGGTGTMAKGSIDKGSSYTLPACGFTPPAGKEFKAWQVDGIEKNFGDSIVVKADITVKALWKDKETTQPTPPTPYPWTVFPGYWHNDLETPKSKENKQVNSLINEWKIQLTIGIDLLYKEINGVESNIQMDIAPYIKDGRTMLPVRFVAEALGFDVDWDKSTRTVILKQDKTRVEIPVETNQIIVNGDVYTSDVKPEIKNNRTMLPIANIARALGLKDGKDIIWDSNTRTVTIYRSIIVK